MNIGKCSFDSFSSNESRFILPIILLLSITCCTFCCGEGYSRSLLCGSSDRGSGVNNCTSRHLCGWWHPSCWRYSWSYTCSFNSGSSCCCHNYCCSKVNSSFNVNTKIMLIPFNLSHLLLSITSPITQNVKTHWSWPDHSKTFVEAFSKLYWLILFIFNKYLPCLCDLSFTCASKI